MHKIRLDARTLMAFLALSSAGVACFGPPRSASPEDAGIIRAAVQLAPGTTLDTVSYAIAGPGGFARAGDVDVSRSQTISFTVGGIPAGEGYSVSITGTASDRTTSCSGSATFAVTPRMTTALSVKIQCREQPRTGSVQINGTVNVCPVVDGVSASPGEVIVGSSSGLAATAHDADGRPAAIAYSWVATSGMLAGATTAAPTLLCTAAGTSTVTLTISDGDCSDTSTVTVVCSPGGGGAAGAGGAAGVAGAAGAAAGAGGGLAGAGGGAPAPAIHINEIESNQGMPGDWVELYNAGTSPVDVGGWLFRDNDDTHNYLIPAGTVIPAGGYFVLEEAAFGFGLGAAESARLYDTAMAIVDSYTWTAHAAITYGRCPSGSGAFVEQPTATKAMANACGGQGGSSGAGGGAAGGGQGGSAGVGGGPAGMGGAVATLPWPGDDAVVTVDAMNQFASNLSGLTYQPATAASPSVLWASLNSPSLLFRLVWDATTATWVNTSTDGWAGGKTLHYATGLGAPDSEGVTTAELSSSAIYVGSERDNLASAVSRLVVLRFDTAAAGVELTATNDWDLTADLPVVGANLGIEAITWIPDSLLVSRGFADEAKAHAYTPAEYPSHGPGL